MAQEAYGALNQHASRFLTFAVIRLWIYSHCYQLAWRLPISAWWWVWDWSTDMWDVLKTLKCKTFIIFATEPAKYHRMTCPSPALSGAVRRLHEEFQSCWTQTDIVFAGSPSAPEQHWHPSELHHTAPGSSIDHLWFACREGRYIICPHAQDGGEKNYLIIFIVIRKELSTDLSCSNGELSSKVSVRADVPPAVRRKQSTVTLLIKMVWHTKHNFNSFLFNASEARKTNLKMASK